MKKSMKLLALVLALVLALGMLAGTCHLSYSDHLLNLQAEICRFCGGNLYRIVVDGEEGCLAAEYYNVADRRVQCKELLISPGRMARAASLLAEAMPSSRYHLRSPAFWDGLPGSYIQSFAMLKWYDPDLHRQWSRSSDCYIGFAFD